MYRLLSPSERARVVLECRSHFIVETEDTTTTTDTTQQQSTEVHTVRVLLLFLSLY
jgi:hypothetical protein